MNLEPNREIVASIIWPSLILFNRIGNCTINVITHRSHGIQIDDTRLIHFNTTINAERMPDYMLYYFNDMKKKYGYAGTCESVDLNPFDKCKPFNCELKYFGTRNFFQYPNCVPQIVCENDPNVIYDYEKNECRNLNNLFSMEDIKKLKRGRFDHYNETNETNESNGKESALRRARRSLNGSQTFADMLINSTMFIVKIVSA